MSPTSRSTHCCVCPQYVKQENLTIGEHGKEARATRLITERASHRIGKMAFEIALGRPRKVLHTRPPYASTAHPLLLNSK